MSNDPRRKGGFDPMSLAAKTTTIYPPPFAAEITGRAKRALGNAAGLNNFGVNLVHLNPGSWSSQRHWHTTQDEFVYVLEGELTLIDDSGEQLLAPGMAAGFPAGEENGHHFVNNGNSVAIYLEVGDRTPADAARYSDIDLMAEPQGGGAIGYHFRRKDGSPYPTK